MRITWSAPEELEFLPGATIKPDLSLFYPGDPKQLPPGTGRRGMVAKDLIATVMGAGGEE